MASDEEVDENYEKGEENYATRERRKKKSEREKEVYKVRMRKRQRGGWRERDEGPRERHRGRAVRLAARDARFSVTSMAAVSIAGSRRLVSSTAMTRRLLRAAVRGFIQLKFLRKIHPCYLLRIERG